MTENNDFSAFNNVLDEAKKKVAGVAEEVFAAMMAQELARLAETTAAKIRSTDDAPVEAADETPAEAMEDVVAKDCAEGFSEETETAETASQSEISTTEPAVLFDETADELTLEVSEAVAEEAVNELSLEVSDAAAYELEEDDEPCVVHFEDEDDEFDENGERIPLVPYD